MNTKSQKITLAAIAALSFLFISTQGCQKAAERPAKINAKISNELIDITKIADITSDAKFQPDAQANNSILLDKAISKVTDENQKTELMQLKDRGQLAFRIDDVQSQIILIKVMNSNDVREEDTRGKTFYSLTALKSSKTNQFVFEKSNLIVGSVSGTLTTSATVTTSATAEVSTTATADENKNVASEKKSEPFYIELIAIGFKSGVLEHEKTDYNEKKSILNLEERPLRESTHIILTTVVESK